MRSLAPYEGQFNNKDRKALLATSLKIYRNAVGLSQKEVAEVLGISIPTYSGYERGASEPDIETLVRLSYLFGVSTDTLLQRNFLGTDSTITGNLKSYKEQHDEMLEYFKGNNKYAAVGLMKMIDKFTKQLNKEASKLSEEAAKTLEDMITFKYIPDDEATDNNESVDEDNK